MMMPKVVMETKTNNEDGTYLKHIFVHAPEWKVHLEGVGEPLTEGPWPVSKKIDHFLLSETNCLGYIETLVFPANPQGQPVSYHDIAGGRGYTADQVLCTFGKIMLEAGYDTV
jgi:hypothetical protein